MHSIDNTISNNHVHATTPIFFFKHSDKYAQGNIIEKRVPT